MKETFLGPGGVPAKPMSLRVPRARGLADAAGGGLLDYVRLVECRRRESDAVEGGAEIVIVDLEVERPQKTAYDIRRVERLAILVEAGDAFCPEVLALRSDFPQVPHLNLQPEGSARSLCLYDQSWDELRPRWTPAAFIERIRRWLADTAVGRLHRDDQPLEPLLVGSRYRLVIPSVLVKEVDEAVERIELELVPAGEKGGTLIACRSTERRRNGEPQFIASMFHADARKHGIIQYAPRNLKQLADLVRGENFDLLTELRDRLKGWKEEGYLDAALIIMIAFPLLRQAGDEPEITDLWAFLTPGTVREIGKSIGLWDETVANSKSEVGLLLPQGDMPSGQDMALDIVRPQFSFSRDGGAAANGVAPNPCKAVAVGAGALGSQLILNLVRSGFGSWTLIDKDVFLPHNQARHALPPWCVGAAKAVAVGAMIDGFLEEEPRTRAIVADVLRPGDQKGAIESALSDAELILDFSASVPVSRHLAREPATKARRATLFLNPLGTDLVAIWEDGERTIPLDCLEIPYYRAVVRDEQLRGHLDSNPSGTRYARSCGDVSFSLPSHLVAVHAGIGAQVVRAAVESDAAGIRVWRCDPVTSAISVVDVSIHRVHRVMIGDWTLVIDEGLLQGLASLRSSKLPSETGGVLVGYYDLTANTVYVVDTLPSPPDSEESSSSYIRGSEGLSDRMGELGGSTGGLLEYLGEWHSHPDVCSTLPSEADRKLFDDVTEKMSVAGLPALLGIVGEHSLSRWFVGVMSESRGWEHGAGETA